MQTEPNYNVGIKSSVNFMAFCRRYVGNPKYATFKVKATGVTFNALVFTRADGSRLTVGFSRNLPSLSAKQIAAQRDDLVVVELMSGNFKLARKADDAWETVDLGLE